jgi:hypothetical protein
MTALVAGGLLTGCVVTSVHPFYTRNDAAFEPSLLGQWTNTQQAGESWTFRKEQPDSYHLTYVSDGKTNLCSVYLFKLDGQRFLDVASLEGDCELLPPPAPTHLLLRIEQLTPTARLAPLNHDWLKGLLEKEPKALRHAMLGQKPDDRRVVLTAETPELQEFLKKHLKTADAWHDPLELKHQETPTPSK